MTKKGKKEPKMSPEARKIEEVLSSDLDLDQVTQDILSSIDRVQATIEKLDKAQIVTQETLQLEVSI